MIPGYEILKSCPVNKGCSAKKIYKHKETGNLYNLLVNKGEMKEHSCTTRGSELPVKVYAAAWFNKRTGRTRYLGPTRLLRSVTKAPKEDTSTAEDWTMTDSFEGTVTWNPIQDA
jgi:hypothetical protein